MHFWMYLFLRSKNLTHLFDIINSTKLSVTAFNRFIVSLLNLLKENVISNKNMFQLCGNINPTRKSGDE